MEEKIVIIVRCSPNNLSHMYNDLFLRNCVLDPSIPESYIICYLEW